MIRELVAGKPGEFDSEGFRLRGRDISRVEGLTDGVFALALTLLIVSVEVPQSFGQLLEVIKALPVFAICFATVMWFWAEHHKFSRRYGLTDKATIVLNSLLLFVILFYVYPLKFLFTLVINGLVFHDNQKVGATTITDDQVPQLFLLYGIGFGSIALLFWLLNRHALSLKTVLELDEPEVLITRGEMTKGAFLMVIALLSIAMAYLLPARFLGWAGIVYSLVGVSEGVLSGIYGKKVRLLRERLAQIEAKPAS